MDSPPVSAFAVYQANKNKKSQQKKENLKKKQKGKVSTPRAVTKEIPDDSMETIAKKIKQKQKKLKGSKNLVKIKPLKKKSKKVLLKHTKKSSKNKKVNIVNQETDEDSETEEVPVLMPVSSNSYKCFYRSKADSISEESDSSQAIWNDFTPVQTNSKEEALKVFSWMIAPYDRDDFLKRVWEKKPLHIGRKKPSYYKELVSTPIIDDMLRNENIQYTKNIDITSYKDGERETHNPEGRAFPHVVWDYYLTGCSVRLLNPQTYIKKLHLLNATLQEFFNSFVGANAYLTPPDSQGFAPHYDDIEAFILQIEGKKHWRVYKPRFEAEFLPRVSSQNYYQFELGDPVLEVTLEAGDILYFPRGYIHQANCIDGEHSLHITISMYQKHAWADLFEKMIPNALQNAIIKDVDFRRGLPFDIYDNYGLIHANNYSSRKDEIQEHIETLFDKIKEHLNVNTAVDEMNKEFQHSALPPVLSEPEKEVTVYGNTDRMLENNVIVDRVEIGLDTKIRLLRKNIVRFTMEDGEYRLYYHADNSLEYRERELPYLEIGQDMTGCIENLIKSYPEYLAVENLGHGQDSDKLDLANTLWEVGLIMTEYPLEPVDD